MSKPYLYVDTRKKGFKYVYEIYNYKDPNTKRNKKKKTYLGIFTGYDAEGTPLYTRENSSDASGVKIKNIWELIAGRVKKDQNLVSKDAILEILPVLYSGSQDRKVFQKDKNKSFYSSRLVESIKNGNNIFINSNYGGKFPLLLIVDPKTRETYPFFACPHTPQSQPDQESIEVFEGSQDDGFYKKVLYNKSRPLIFMSRSPLPNSDIPLISDANGIYLFSFHDHLESYANLISSSVILSDKLVFFSLINAFDNYAHIASYGGLISAIVYLMLDFFKGANLPLKYFPQFIDALGKNSRCILLEEKWVVLDEHFSFPYKEK